VVSRSGTLTYEAVGQLTGSASASPPASASAATRSTAPNFIDVLEAFNEDPDTDGVIMIGEIGGKRRREGGRLREARLQEADRGLHRGRTAPPGKRMGHAGAIISGGKGTADDKIAAMEAEARAWSCRPRPTTSPSSGSPIRRRSSEVRRPVLSDQAGQAIIIRTPPPSTPSGRSSVDRRGSRSTDRGRWT
jgi:hypothetical protein